MIKQSLILSFTDMGTLAAMTAYIKPYHYLPARGFATASLLLLFFTLSAKASPPVPFSISYDAHFGSFRARSERSLSFDDTTASWHLQAVSSVKLFGQDLTRITEDSTFTWQDDLPLPLQYSYVQSGLGKRSRSIDFDQASASATWHVNDNSGELALPTPVYDDLSAFLVLRQQLQQGQTDIYFDVLDRDNIKSYHYRVVDTQYLQTALGSFAAVHLERVRDENSKRTTELWLASERDYLLLKLLQEEPDGREIRLEVKSAQLDGKPLVAAALRTAE